MLRPAFGISDLVLLLLFASCLPTDRSLPPPATPAPAAGASATAAPFAFVELFTSEGCSSCPPADALLGDLAGREGVVALAFHVDYWDYLGWRDPYADAAYSARQRTYAALDGRVYTPQMVVNGRVGFVGSRRREAEAHLREALAAPPSVAITATTAVDGDALIVRYAVENAPEGAVLHVALVERATGQDVRRGENRGRRLDHTNVVRHLQTIEAGNGVASLALPDGLTPEAARVAVWVQDGAAGPVLGAVWAEDAGSPSLAR